ncbi:DUF4190 domain-containing protein [Streptomyces sp. NBC_00199]|uniref:DUF4190 domain-containing protein n=1 Tax=Streptomyces sp. NBC_00199 TaxID=2975678 RepID=UPI00224D5A1C|nr:DUF4190 domain-containing protein [Streptomyces sp. NBC_00199]MCX5268010.1 DUF4190 domain-containing protein [Streptomyces sp. NBC_00199]
MSDDAPTPAGDAARDPWPAPASDATDGPRDAEPGTTPRVPLDKAAPAGGAPGAASPLTPSPWAAPGGAAQSGPGHTVAANEPLAPGTGPGPAQDRAPASVHDQRTMTSLPGVTPQPWADPFGSPQPHGALGGFPPPDPATAAGGPPPGHFAAAAHGGPVPPPPIAPDGPGQIPYGYAGGYGYPSPPHYGGAPGLYGWAGGGAGDNNGTGVAGLVLGILAAVVFCLWPLAIVFGILGVVFGAIGRGKARRGEASNPGQALAGIICGAVGLVLAVGVGVLTIVAP